MFATTEKKEKKRKETAHIRAVNKPNANQGVLLAPVYEGLPPAGCTNNTCLAYNSYELAQSKHV